MNVAATNGNRAEIFHRWYVRTENANLGTGNILDVKKPLNYLLDKYIPIWYTLDMEDKPMKTHPVERRTLEIYCLSCHEELCTVIEAAEHLVHGCVVESKPRRAA